MKAFRSLALVTLTALLGACANLPVNRDADVEMLIRASGINAQLTALSQPLNPDAVNGAGGMIPNDVINAINSAVAGAIDPDQVRSNVKTSFTKNLSDAQLRDALSFFNSATGQHVVAAETSAANIGNYAGSAQPGQLDALDDATGVSRIFGKLAEQSTSSAIDVLISSNCLGTNNIPFAGMMAGVIKKAQINAVRRSVRQVMNQRYAALTPDEVSSYLSFAQSSAGQQFFQSRNQAFMEATSTASGQISTILTAQIAKTCKN